jgi:hypothetical protein
MICRLGRRGAHGGIEDAVLLDAPGDFAEVEGKAC